MKLNDLNEGVFGPTLTVDEAIKKLMGAFEKKGFTVERRKGFNDGSFRKLFTDPDDAATALIDGLLILQLNDYSTDIGLGDTGTTYCLKCTCTNGTITVEVRFVARAGKACAHFSFVGYAR